MQNIGWKRIAATAGSILLLAATLTHSAPVEQAWEQTYNGGYEDNLQGMALDGNGNVYVLGYSANASNSPSLVTIKYSPDGTQLWLRRYDYGLPSAIAVNDVGEVWVTALSQTTNSAAYLTIKYDPDGAELWARRVAGANQWATEPRALAADAFGNAFVTGFRRVAEGVDTITTVKYSPDGDELWVRAADAMDWVSALAVDNDGNVILSGADHDENNILQTATVKYDTAGNVQWAAQYASGEAVSLAVDPAGNIYEVGIGAAGILTLKYTPQGALLWSASYAGPPGQSFEGRGVKVDNEGNVYVMGDSYSTGNLPRNLITLKYDSAGNRLWSARYTAQNNLWFVLGGVTLDSAGNAYLRDDSSFLALKYAPDGNLRWAVSRASGYTRAIAVSDSGDVYLAANSPPAIRMSPTDYDDLDLMKYTQFEIPSQPRAFVTPVEQEGIAGSNTVFSASVVGPGPFTYQWRANAKPLPGQTNSSLILASVQPTNVGDYSVIVSNAAGYTISPEARLTTVHIPATITSTAQTNKLVVGENKTFAVTAIGDPSPSFQWYFNGDPIPDGNSTYLELTNLQESDSGLYTVIASNIYGVAMSAPYQLTVFTSPTTLSLKGWWVDHPNLYGFSEAVRVAGHYAYLANGRAGLELIDVSNPNAPFRVVNYDSGSFAQDVDVAGKYAYVADIDTGLHILDIQDPAHPSLVGRYALGNDQQFLDTPNVLQVVSTVGYILNGDGLLQVLDLSDVTHPSLVATYWPPEPGTPKGLRVVGNRVYVVGERWINEDDTVGFLQIFDASQPTNLTQLGVCDTPSAETAWGVDVAQGYASVAGGFTVVNVQNPTNPVPVGSLNNLYGWAEAVQVRGDYAFLAGEFIGLTVVDVSDPAAPVRVAQYPMGTGQDEGWDVHVVGNYAYVARGDLGLLIFEIEETRNFTSIIRVGNKLTLRWNGTRGLKLQHCASLSSPFWEDVTGSDGLSSMELPMGTGNDFFRLARE